MIVMEEGSGTMQVEDGLRELVSGGAGLLTLSRSRDRHRMSRWWNSPMLPIPAWLRGKLQLKSGENALVAFIVKHSFQFLCTYLP